MFSTVNAFFSFCILYLIIPWGRNYSYFPFMWQQRGCVLLFKVIQLVLEIRCRPKSVPYHLLCIIFLNVIVGVRQIFLLKKGNKIAVTADQFKQNSQRERLLLQKVDMDNFPHITISSFITLSYNQILQTVWHFLNHYSSNPEI